ncbi:hypothetical protein [Peribacillus frigoritolerans]|uniref:hypothetical protein n=1 Tax=Peribacillus frigoritolerans TaxID=450367 RepID=UPI0020BDB238|nr:hypothetical protein [Peribacillus frigoritolerans]
MEYKNYYLIKVGNSKIVVLAKTSVEAINIWIENGNNERIKDNRRPNFNPNSYSIELLEREDLVLKASE